MRIRAKKRTDGHGRPPCANAKCTARAVGFRILDDQRQYLCERHRVEMEAYYAWVNEPMPRWTDL